MIHMKYQITIHDPEAFEAYTSITMTPELEALVAEPDEAPARRRMGAAGRIAAFALAALLPLLAIAGCDNGPGPNGDDPVAPISASYNPADHFSPADGTVIGPDDDPVAWSFDAPAATADCQADPDCSATIAGGIESVDLVATADSGTPADGSDDDSHSVFSDTAVAYDSTVNGSIPFSTFHSGAGLEDGERVTLEATLVALDAEGNEHTARGSVELLYEEGVVNPVRIPGCSVNGSSLGLSLLIQCEGEAPGGMADLFGNWEVSGGPSGTAIGDTGQIYASTMGPGDVGLHTYTVTVNDGTYTSDPFVFTVPVDEHKSTLNLHCSDSSEHNLLLPETSVDAVATACGSGFNPSLKPSTSSDADYILDVDEGCVEGAVSALTAAERDSHDNYNSGTTVDDVYSSCTVDFAQVVYESND